MARAIHRILVSIAIGLPVVCSGNIFTGQAGAQPASGAGEQEKYSGGSASQALQEQRYEIRTRDMAGAGPAVMAAQPIDVQNDVQNENLGGGFYKDGYKADDWFYDYYESSVVGTDPQVSERPATRDAQAVRVAEQDRLADASQSKNSPFYTRRRHAQDPFHEPAHLDHRAAVLVVALGVPARVPGDLAVRRRVVVRPPERVAVRHRRESAVERQDLESVPRQFELANDLGPEQRHDVGAD